MKTAFLFLFVAATAAATAQTPTKPAAPRPAASLAGSLKLPPGVPPVKAITKTAFALRYQDIKIGTGPEAQPNQMYKVQYTGWLASDGHKFDSSYDHRQPVMDKDGKPVMGDDGKPKLGDAQPFSFPQGFGRLIPGWDDGFYRMKIGGKRRLFIPWQLAYGERGRPGPDATHPGIPAKADLIFDIELLDVTPLAMPANHPGMMGAGHPMPGAMPHPAPSATPAAPSTAPAPATSPSAATTPAPATAPTTPASDPTQPK
jgi:peptidylprolyl isomerase